MKKVVLMLTVSFFARILVAQEIDISPFLGEHWYGLYMNGGKVGFMKTDFRVNDNGEIVAEQSAEFRLTMMGLRQDMKMVSRRIYTREGELKALTSITEDMQGTKQIEGRLDGDDFVVTTPFGEQAETRIPKPKESLRDALKGADAIRNGATVGDAISFYFFEPMYLKEFEATSEITSIETQTFQGAPTKVYTVETTIPALGLSTVSQIAEDGTTLEDAVGGMLTMRLEPEAIAKDVAYSNDAIIANAVTLEAPITDARTRESLELRITGPIDEGHRFSDDRQTMTAIDGGVLFASRLQTLDDEPRLSLPITDPAQKQWLEPSTLIQSGHPKVVEKAQAILDGETDGLAATEKLCHWVYENVETKYSAQVSNSLEVLETLSGDCTEHTALFVGLARAAGLPAREVAGLIYVGTPTPGFYFHQWAKVWVGKWIDVDPTFDQPLADTTHVKLAEGDLLDQVRLVPLIGHLEIEVVD